MKKIALFVGMLLSGIVNGNNMGSNLQRKMEVVTFGAGCFWCVEAIFQEIKGVESVVSGYMGGEKDASYKEVCSGKTGHAEVCQITFDPKVIGFEKLLEVFWQTHDPTTLNRQGADIGSQYRSVVFYHTEEQKKLTEDIKQKLNTSGAWDKPIVTEITPKLKFFKAENYHQDYFDNNSDQPYCSTVIKPKKEKFKKAFNDILK